MTATAQTSPHRPTRRGRWRWRLALVAFTFTLLALVVAAAAIALAYERSLEGRIVPGVTVGGVTLDGLDAAAAQARLSASLPEPTAGELTLEVGEQLRSLSYARIDRRYEFGPALDAALAVGRDGGPMERAGDHFRTLLRGVPHEVTVTYDAQAVDEAVTAMVAAIERPLVEARVQLDSGRYVARRSELGVDVDGESLRAAAHAALAALGTGTRSTRVSTQPLLTEPTHHTDVAEAAADRANAIVAAGVSLADGTTTHAIPVETVRSWLLLQAQGDGSYIVEVPDDAVEADLVGLAETLAVRPTDAGLTFAETGSIMVVPAMDGRALDTAATAERIVAALHARPDGAAEGPVDLIIEPVTARYTTGQAEAAAPEVVRLSSWTTRFTPGESNFFGANISVPTTRIHGQSVAPGRQFDFWKAIGTVSEAEGYGPGGVIINGRTEPTGAVGGGICSCSTTIFNAALRAGLEMGARRNHSYYIDRYPLGLDATVFISSSGSVQTMRFRNDTAHPILIKGINGHGSVRFEIWSVPTGRTVEFSEPLIRDRREARDTIEYTDDLAPGVRSRVEYPIDGFRSWVTRTVRDASGAIIHEETYYSPYAAIDGITLVGRSPGDPPDGTVVVVG
ncbi:MAG: VanW family protein [Chloroflexi bacterium]|nr:VanW family protein [Chloroflexota bacterium]